MIAKWSQNDPKTIPKWTQNPSTLGSECLERSQGEGGLPPPPTPSSAGPLKRPSRQSLGRQLRNFEAEAPFQPEPAKASYPKGGLPRGSLWDHLAHFGFGLEVLELGFEVLWLGFKVLEPGFEASEPGFEVLGFSES